MPVPKHPGLILRRDYLRPASMTQVALAERIGVSFPRVNEIVNGKRGITVDTALRLARLFGTTPQYWLNLQRDYDLSLAVQTSMEAIHRIEPLAAKEEARVRWWPSSSDE
jgi:addiction module HigA family antidote